MNYSLFENIEKPVIIIDKCGIVHFANKHFVELFSIDNISVPGKHYKEYFYNTNLYISINDYINNYFPFGKNLKKILELNLNNLNNLEICFNPLLEDSLFSLMIHDLSNSNYTGITDLQIYKDRYNSLFNNIKAGVVVYRSVDSGEDFVIVEMNKEAQLIDSFEKENVLGKRLTDVWPGIKEFGLLEVLQKVWLTGKPGELPISLYQDKERIGWRYNLVYKLNTGEIVAIYTDETDNVKAQKQFKELNERFSLFLDNFPGYAYMRGLNGEVYYGNKSFKEDINIHSENGENIKNHKFSIEDLNQFREQDLYVLRENKSKSFEDVINGCHLLTTKFPISIGKKNDIIGGISVDITQLRNNELQLIRLNEFKNILLSLIAHDLKSPFNVQLGFLEMLINEFYSFDDEKKLEYLKIIYESTSGSFQLLNNLLEWSNSNINDVKHHPKDTQLKPIIDRVIQQNTLNLSVKNIDIVTYIPEDIIVFTDENMLEVVIRNIFVNAIKFSKPYGDIRIKAENLNNEVVIKIEDNGIGMSDSIIGKLFEMTFDKVRNGTKGERGTGLGLFLCNEFVKKNNGRIRVESEINKGSTFFIYLPCIK